ncbi:MAG: hypothetical protein AABZ33_10255 [Chloroflexota bacterium]
MTTIRRRLAVLILVVAPPVALFAALFGGDHVVPCLAPNGCPPIPGPIPIIGTTIGAIATIVAGGLLWFAAAVGIVVHVARADLGRLRRAAIAIALVTIVPAVYGFAVGAQVRIRQGAEDAALYAIAAFIVATTLSLAWAGMTARRWKAALPRD